MLGDQMMRELNPEKVFVQYRGIMQPNKPVMGRKYTLTHSDTTAQLFVFVATEYAEDQITGIRDEVRVGWEKVNGVLVLIGSVVVDGKGVEGNTYIRNSIFYNEMPLALQTLRQGDRFLFEKEPELDKAQVYIQFISDTPIYNKIYDFGEIGQYRMDETVPVND